MANKSLFGGAKTSVPAANTINEAGGVAYKMSDKHALAQLAATGTLNDTFYVSANDQLKTVLDLTSKLEDEFIAKTAVYSRNAGYMKDMPALLMVILSKRNPYLFEKVFPRVINNGKMLRNFVQMVRSGTAGRKCLGSAPKRMIQNWLNSRTPEQLLNASVGNDPSLKDVIKLAHPKPKGPAYNALFAYLIDKEYDKRSLPKVVKQYENWKKGEADEVPMLDFRLLDGLKLGKKEWVEIAKNANWHMTRMNLNTFLRHGVFDDKKMVKLVADRLRDPEAIKKAKIFPYQLMVAYEQTTEVPNDVREALQDAMEIATENVPIFDGKVWVFTDVSGSMQSNPVTGFREGSTTTVNCLSVAALVSAVVARANKGAEVVAFSDDVIKTNLNMRDTVLTNAEKLKRLPSGGTNCSAPMAMLNAGNHKGDVIVYVSDNESWLDSNHGNGYHFNGHRGTQTMAEWKTFKKRNPKAKMICIDLAVNTSTQANESKDILNVGGFSDAVFEMMKDFIDGTGIDGWVEKIEKIDLDRRQSEE